MDDFEASLGNMESLLGQLPQQATGSSKRILSTSKGSKETPRSYPGK